MDPSDPKKPSFDWVELKNLVPKPKSSPPQPPFGAELAQAAMNERANHNNSVPAPAAQVAQPAKPSKSGKHGSKKKGSDKGSHQQSQQKRVVSDAGMHPSGAKLTSMLSPIQGNSAKQQQHASSMMTVNTTGPTHELNHHHGAKLQEAMMVRHSHDGTTMPSGGVGAVGGVRGLLQQAHHGGAQGETAGTSAADGGKKKPRPSSGVTSKPHTKKSVLLPAEAQDGAAGKAPKASAMPRSQFLLREANQKKIAETEVQSARMHPEAVGAVNNNANKLQHQQHRGMKWDFKQPVHHQHSSVQNIADQGIAVQGKKHHNTGAVGAPSHHLQAGGAHSHPHSFQPSPVPPPAHFHSGPTSRVGSRSQSPQKDDKPHHAHPSQMLLVGGSNSARTVSNTKLPVPPPVSTLQSIVNEANNTSNPSNPTVSGAPKPRRQSALHKGLPSATTSHQHASGDNAGMMLQVKGSAPKAIVKKADDESENLLEELEANVAAERLAREEMRRAHRQTITTFRKLVLRFRSSEQERQDAGLPPASPLAGTGSSVASAKCGVVVHMLACHVQAFMRARQSRTFVRVAREVGGAPSQLALRASLAKSKPMALDMNALRQSSTPFAALHGNTTHGAPMSNTKAVTSARGEAQDNALSATERAPSGVFSDNGSFDVASTTHLDSETISHLKQLYFDYYDCESFALDGTTSGGAKRVASKQPSSSSTNEMPTPIGVASSSEYMADIDQSGSGLPPLGGNGKIAATQGKYEPLPLGRRLVASAGNVSNPSRLSGNLQAPGNTQQQYLRNKADLTPVTAFAMKTAYAEIHDLGSSGDDDDSIYTESGSPSPVSKKGGGAKRSTAEKKNNTQKVKRRHHEHQYGSDGLAIPPLELYNVIEEENVLIPTEDAAGDVEVSGDVGEQQQQTQQPFASYPLGEDSQHPSADDLVVVGTTKPAHNMDNFEVVHVVGQQPAPYQQAATDNSFVIEEEDGLPDAVGDLSARRGQFDDIIEDLSAEAQLSCSPQGNGIISEIIEEATQSPKSIDAIKGGTMKPSATNQLGVPMVAEHHGSPHRESAMSPIGVGGISPSEASVSPGLMFNAEKEKRAIHGSGMSCSSPDDEMM